MWSRNALAHGIIRCAACGYAVYVHGDRYSKLFYPPRNCRPVEIETSRDRALVKRVKARVVAGASGPGAETLLRRGMDLLIRIAKTLEGESTNDGA
jgi:hypothetical protein